MKKNLLLTALLMLVAIISSAQTLGAKITDVTQITDDGIYAIQGLINCDPLNHWAGDEGPLDPHFYTGTVSYGKTLNAVCAFSITRTEDGKFNIQSLADGKYWAKQDAPGGWSTGRSTIHRTQAADITIKPNNNSNLPGSFVLYHYIDTMNRDGAHTPYVIFQDWGENLGTYSVSDLKYNDNDGEGEWYIYRLTMDSPYQYWLSNLASTAIDMGFVCSEDPGCYKDLGALPTLLAEAQAAIDAKDEAECKTLVAKINDAIAGIEHCTPNPIVEGVYAFESGCSNFFETQGKHKALYVYYNDYSSEYPTTQYKLYWGDAPEGGYKQADDRYKFRLIPAKDNEQVAKWIKEGNMTEEDANNAYYIKNIGYDTYISHVYMTGYPIGTTSSASSIYIINYHKDTGKFDIRYPMQNSFSLYANNHKDGAGESGDVTYQPATAEQSQWRLRKIEDSPAQVQTIALEGENGTLSGAGEYPLGAEAKITARPDAGYTFAGWYSDGALLSDKAEYSFTVKASMTITAKFYKLTGKENTLTLNSLRCAPGNRIQIPVGMTNSASITALQLDLYLPEGMSIAEEDGEPMTGLDAARKTNSHSISSSQLPNGATRIVAYSSANKPFAGNDGNLLNVTIDIPSNAECRNYTIELKEIILAATDGSEYYIPSLASDITVSKIIGDANMDATVTISDVVATVNYILEKQPAKFDLASADVNGDGYIRMGDVVGIVNIILGNSLTENARNAKPVAQAAVCETLTADNATGYGNVTLPLSLNNSGSYTSFQMDVTLPEGTTLSYATLSRRAAADHTVAWSKTATGKVRIVAYSATNSRFTDNSGELLSLTIESAKATGGNIRIDNIIMTDAEGRETSIGECSSTIDINGTTAVPGTEADALRIYTAGGTLIVESDRATTLPVYSTDGRLAETLHIAAGKNLFNSLGKGVYIISRTKTIIK